MPPSMFDHAGCSGCRRIGTHLVTDRASATADTGHALMTVDETLEHCLVRTTGMARLAFAARMEREGIKVQ